MSRHPGGVFLSYRRQDKHAAGRLADGLISRFGWDRVFVDVDDIAPGVDFVVAISDAIARCDLLIAVIGPEWATLVNERTGRRKLDDPQDVVVLEIAAALARGIRVIPVLVDDAAMPVADELPESIRELSRRQAVEVEHGSFRTDLDRVLRSVDGILSAAHRSRRAVPPSTGSRPWPAPTPPIPQPVPPAPGSRAVPLRRAAVRMGLWWLLYILAELAAFVLAYVIRTPSVATVLVGVLLAGGLAAGITVTSTALRREIARQRAMLGAVLLGSVGRPLSRTWVRGVALLCVWVNVVFAVALVMVPISPAR